VFGQHNGKLTAESGHLRQTPENIWQDAMDVLEQELIQILPLYTKQTQQTHGLHLT
jgi:hypothetical protein